MKILDGKKLAEKIKQDIKKRVSRMGKKPVLAIVLVGRDPASVVYVRSKKVACWEAGINSREIKLSKNVSQNKLLREIGRLNQDKEVDGILVQLPLPKKIDSRKILESIDCKKDADCVHPLNFGKFIQNGIKDASCVPATAWGVDKILDEYNISVAGKCAVVVGYSNLAGKPIAQTLASRDATVTVCHNKTRNLGRFTKNADILVSAVGKKNLIKGNMVKKGAVVIDVGISREGGKICGDVDFKSVSKKASYITPVPGGVGPMTVAMLMRNVVRLAEK